MPLRVADAFKGRGRSDDVRHEDRAQGAHARLVICRAKHARAREFDGLPWRVADYPRVVPRRYLVRVSTFDIHLAAVLDHDVQVAAGRRAEMADLAARRTHLRCHVRRPAPARLKSHPADGGLVEVDHVHPAATEIARPFWSGEVLSL